MKTNPVFRSPYRKVFAALSLTFPLAGLFAGEIVLTPDNTSKSPSHDAASDLRNRARAQRVEGTTTTPMTTIVEQLEESPFGTHPQNAATENRNRAHSYQQGGNGSTPSDLGRILVDPDSNQGKANLNMDRARAYMKGESPGVTGTRFGGTGNLPVVECNNQSAASVVARIGDDNTTSGSVIILIRDGKSVKVRCK
ncbi:MAG: hypothetical protein IPH35_22680 [Rhodoferax sp.]|nr:hypothetical protein [Rhodoferax sp.]